MGHLSIQKPRKMVGFKIGAGKDDVSAESMVGERHLCVSKTIEKPLFKTHNGII